MKTSFLPKLINGPTGDPALFVDILRARRALLFDCGELHLISPSEVLRTSDLFISHAHIDHFIGFDQILRLHLGRGRRVRVFGPRGITACVRGKLAGYSWNLVRHQRLVFEVHEWDGDEVLVTEFLCRRRFRQPESRREPAGPLLWRDELIQVRAVVLDHRLPCLAYAVTERDFYNVDPVQLEACGLRPGAWLNALKDWVRAGRPEQGPLAVDGRELSASELADRLLILSPGRTLVYATDLLGNPANLEALGSLARGADWLFCEGAFLDEDSERARETYHLTARQAGELARSAGVRRVIPFHFSPKYEGRFEELEREAQLAFGGPPPGEELPPLADAGGTTQPD